MVAVVCFTFFQVWHNSADIISILVRQKIVIRTRDDFFEDQIDPNT